MRNWSEYTWLLNHMVETGFIKTIREIWWDVRPHHNFGTVEVRICDMPPNLEHVLGLTALIQCLVHDLSEEIDRGTYQFDCHPFMIRQNKWRACRYGMDAKLVDAATHQAIPARQVVHSLVDRLADRAEELGCIRYLEIVHEMADQPTGSVRQLADLPGDPQPRRSRPADARAQRADGHGHCEVARPSQPLIFHQSRFLRDIAHHRFERRDSIERWYRVVVLIERSSLTPL